MDAEFGVGKRTADERERIESTEQPDMAVLAGEEQLRPGRPRSSSSAHWTSSRTSTSPEPGAISTVQQRIGACSLIRSSPVTRPTRSSPSLAESRRWASWASIRSGPA